MMHGQKTLSQTNHIYICHEASCWLFLSSSQKRKKGLQTLHYNLRGMSNQRNVRQFRYYNNISWNKSGMPRHFGQDLNPESVDYKVTLTIYDT